MAGASRRGYGEDGIYFDHRDDCRDSAHHKTCSGRWRGVVSLGYAADGKRIRKKVSGPTRTEVKDKLKALHSELDAGVRTAAGYTVDMAVTDWLAEGLPGRAAKTVEVYRDALRPVLAVIGRDPAAGRHRPGRPHCAHDDGRHPLHAEPCRRRTTASPAAAAPGRGTRQGGGAVAGAWLGVHHHRGHAV